MKASIAKLSKLQTGHYLIVCLVQSLPQRVGGAVPCGQKPGISGATSHSSSSKLLLTLEATSFLRASKPHWSVSSNSFSRMNWHPTFRRHIACRAEVSSPSCPAIILATPPSRSGRHQCLFASTSTRSVLMLLLRRLWLYHLCGAP